MTKQYAERDIMDLDEIGGYYTRHVMAMTGENLRGKSDIAAELAWRDAQIAELQEDNAILRDTRAGLSRECNAFEKQIAALAAENVVLKDCIFKQSAAVENWNSWADEEDKIINEPETPATDAAANALRAEGAIAARNALILAEDDSDIYATVAAVIDQLREGKA